jgi:hypothetical protein
MAIEKQALDTIACTYVGAMTSIRGRRVHRLLMREFSRFDHVLPAIAEDGAAALLALADDGSAAACRTDGRGAAVDVVECAHLQGATVTTAYDLTKDSLPLVSCTIWHPGWARSVGALTVSAAHVALADDRRIADLLRKLKG